MVQICLLVTLKYINQSNHLVTDSDDTDTEENLESDVLSKKKMTTRIMKINPITKRTLSRKFKLVI